MGFIEKFTEAIDKLPHKLPEKAVIGDLAKDENGIVHVFTPQGFIELDEANKMVLKAQI